jgi:hypothetical protein
MEYTAIALAALGMVAGLRVRLQVLLLFLALLLLISVAYLAAQHIDLAYALLIILAAQAIFQGGYFMGLIVRHLFTANRRHTLGEARPLPAPRAQDPSVTPE